MNKNERNNKKGIYFLTILTLVLVVLKLFSGIEWSWWIVSPILIMVAWAALTAIVTFVTIIMDKPFKKIK